MRHLTQRPSEKTTRAWATALGSRPRSWARALRPHHPEYVWRAVRTSDPLMVIPLTPGALADIADVLVKHVSPPAADIPRQDPPRKRRSS